METRPYRNIMKLKTKEATNIKEIILNICLVAVATALFRMLVPENNFKKQIGFLISCFFITAVVAFITGATPDLANLPDEFAVVFDGAERISDFTTQTTAQRKRAIGEEVAARVRGVLEENEIYPSEIRVVVNISGSYSISINEIRLVLPPGSDMLRASALVEGEVGDGIKVTIDVE
ncbi:MAG: stage III sporulation protein AF [Oscillospiraceae bacterium]|nr:stage III sporulation protein AF [Oscillospiraceae bacterium]